MMVCVLSGPYHHMGTERLPLVYASPSVRPPSFHCPCSTGRCPPNSLAWHVWAPAARALRADTLRGAYCAKSVDVQMDKTVTPILQHPSGCNQCDRQHRVWHHSVKWHNVWWHGAWWCGDRMNSQPWGSCCLGPGRHNNKCDMPALHVDALTAVGLMLPGPWGP